MNLSASAKKIPILSAAAVGVIVTLLAATGDGLEMPLTKLFAADAGVFMSLAFLFLGGMTGMLATLLFGGRSKAVFHPERHLRKKDIWKLLAAIGFTLLANFLIITGLQQEFAGVASILQNIMTVATVVFAFLFLKEKISKRLGIGVALIVLGSVALSITNLETFSFSTGTLLLIGGYIAYGGLFTITKLLADRNPVEYNLIRCICAGIIVFIIALCMGESLPSLSSAAGLMVTGFIVNGLAPMLLMYGQRYLGAAKAVAIFGISPLFGVLIAFPLLGELPQASFLAALIMFIPGMYFVITKHTGKAAEAEPDDESDRGDAEYVKSLGEERKTALKNQFTSMGLLVIAMFFVMMLLDVLGKGTEFDAADATAIFAFDSLPSGMILPGLIFALFLLLIGIVLLVFGKRVLTAVTFIQMVPQMIAFVFFGNIPLLTAVSGVFSLIFAIILLTSKDSQKYAYAAVNFLLGVAFISNIFSSTLCCIIVAAAALIILWYAVVCGTGRLQHSVSKHLTEDGEMTFNRCGAVVGYFLFANILATEFVFTSMDPASLPSMDSILPVGVLYVLMFVLVGLLLVFIGKRKNAAMFFIGTGIAYSLVLFSTGLFAYLSVIFILVFAIMIILHKNSPILPASLMFGNGFAILLYWQVVYFPDVQMATILIAFVSLAVALYLAFAVFSEKPKLPVF